MQSLDKQVIEQTQAWLSAGTEVWLCTVLASYGSSPRAPGSMLVAQSNGQHVGSLSGGCVEEDFLQRIQKGAFKQPCEWVRYGADTNLPDCKVTLPCGGTLEVLIEHLTPCEKNLNQVQALHNTLLRQELTNRRVCLSTGNTELTPLSTPGPRVGFDSQQRWVDIFIGPVARLIIAGVSPVSYFCAEFALSLGFEVIVCDPEQSRWQNFTVNGIQTEQCLPSEFIANKGAVHQATAIVALTHDPRIDDLAMLEAVLTDAFYIGVMGSYKTSDARAERLQRIGRLTDEQIARIHMPIGLVLGSNTPAEIALAVMADVLRVQKGKSRSEL